MEKGTFAKDVRMSKDPSEVAIKETIKALAKPIQDFLTAVIGEPSKELGGWIADNIRGKRFETQVRIFTKAQRLTQEAGIQPSAVNLKILVPLLENGSLENNETIIDMWAHLLANASVSNRVRASYIDILKDLEPIEAKIVQYIYEQFKVKYGNNFTPSLEYAGSISGELIKDNFNLDDIEFEQSIDNLYRLRLLAPSASRLEFLDINKETPFAHYTKNDLGVTYLGYYFARECNSLETTKNTTQ